jgi:MFS family permease
MIGRPFIGLSSDRWGRLNLATFLSLLCGLMCFAFWIPAEAAPAPMGILCFFAIVGGAAAGVFWTTIAPVAAEVIGLQDLPAGLSLTWFLLVPATTFAEPIALELRHQHAHSWIYLPPQIFTGVMYVASGLSLWVVRGWKVGQLEWQVRQNRGDINATHQAKPPVEEKNAVRADGQGPELQDTYASRNDEAGRGNTVTKDDIWRLPVLLRNMVAWKVV